MEEGLAFGGRVWILSGEGRRRSVVRTIAGDGGRGRLHDVGRLKGGASREEMEMRMKEERERETKLQDELQERQEKRRLEKGAFPPPAQPFPLLVLLRDVNLLPPLPGSRARTASSPASARTAA